MYRIAKLSNPSRGVKVLNVDVFRVAPNDIEQSDLFHERIVVFPDVHISAWFVNHRLDGYRITHNATSSSLLVCDELRRFMNFLELPNWSGRVSDYGLIAATHV